MTKSDKEIWEESVKKENKWILFNQLKWRILGHRYLKFIKKRKLRGLNNFDWLNMDLYIKLMCVLVIFMLGTIVFTTAIQIYEWLYPPEVIQEKVYPYIILCLTETLNVH